MDQSSTDYKNADFRGSQIKRHGFLERRTLSRRSSVLRAVFDRQPTDLEDLSQSHSYVYIMLHPRSQAWQSEVFKRFIATVIVGDLVAFVCSTEPSLQNVNFGVMEGVTSLIFGVEYTARCYTCIENSKFRNEGTIRGRLKWMMTPPAMIDLLATAPFFLQVATGWRLPTLSYLRVFRVLRILKTDGYVRAFGACYRVVYFNREILWVAVLICFFLIIISSVLLYYLRPQNEVEGIDFGSIPSTMYLSTLILTGQDSFIESGQDMPWYTKMVVGFTGALSVAMFAIPVSLLTWGFEAEAERCARRERKVVKQAQSSIPNLEKTDSVNSDDEYLRIIAKDTSDKFLTKSAHLKVQMESYLQNDADGRKHIALAEFLDSGLHRDPSFLDNGYESLAQDIADLQHDMANLESSVTQIGSKLDTICNLLMETRAEPRQIA